MKKTTIIVIAAIVAALLVTGGVLTAVAFNNLSALAPKPAATATPEPTSDVEAIDEPSEVPDVPEVAAGEVVDAAAAEAINADRGSGIRAYPMTDGTFVIVVKDEPLPAQVQDQVNAIATGKSEGLSGNGIGQTTYDSFVNGPERTTGKSVVTVFRMIGSLTPGGPEETFYVIAGASPQMQQISAEARSRDYTVGVAQAFIDRQVNPAEWALVVAD